jgi:hypothetical protein
MMGKPLQALSGPPQWTHTAGGQTQGELAEQQQLGGGGGWIRSVISRLHGVSTRLGRDESPVLQLSGGYRGLYVGGTQISVADYNLVIYNLSLPQSMSPFHPEKWVLVSDQRQAAELTTQQVAAVQARGFQLKGAVMCDDEKAPAQLCSMITAFPAFCHPDTSRCYTGLCSTDAHFEQLGDYEAGPPS